MGKVKKKKKEKKGRGEESLEEKSWETFQWRGHLPSSNGAVIWSGREKSIAAGQEGDREQRPKVKTVGKNEGGEAGQ